MAKPSLVLLHGALGSNRYFLPLIDELKIDFEVYSMNFEGHGDRPSKEPFSIDLFAKNLVQYLTEHKLKNVLVFGYSMGGYVALKVAKDHPELITEIITLGTKFKWSPSIAMKEIAMLNPTIVEEKIPKFAANLKLLHSPNDWKIVMEKTAHVMKLLGDGEGITPTDFEQIQQKVIIGIGDLDKMVTIEESQNIADALPNGHFEILANVVHPIEMITTDVILKFIRKHFLTQ